MNRSPTAVPGVHAAHATDTVGRTGVTVFVFPNGARGGLWTPGSATGSRELGALDPGHIAGEVHAICLAGGSAYGLAAADGVMRALEARGLGFHTPAGNVPIVPAAILFDLHTSTARPDAAMGQAAAESASSEPLAEGRVGAATGARVGAASGITAPGGFGAWAEDVGDGRIVAAGVAVNALGSVVDPGTGAVVAGGAPRTGVVTSGIWRGQTTLAVVVTDVPLDRAQSTVVAKMATAGMARTLYPAFTPFDGDIVFVVSTGTGERIAPEMVAAVGDLAARCVAGAIVRGVTR